MSDFSRNDTIHDERLVRLQKSQDLRKNGTDPYPASTSRTHTLAQARDSKHGDMVTIAGRIMTKRDMGKIAFCHLVDDTGKMQIVLKIDEIGQQVYTSFVSAVDAGDIVEIAGTRFLTQKGEESVLVTRWQMLTKALLPLPDKFHGLQDEELRFRKRYLELVTNNETRDVFRRKATFWQAVRAFLVEQDFLEVETPVLETTPGGADATPFVTHHDALDIDVFLRISMGELWQKRLMVGGYEKTFELGRQFRNEGMSREHLQDYSQMECYWAYADYRQGMRMVETLFKTVAQKTWGKLTFDIGEFRDIDLSQAWREIDYGETVRSMTGVDVFKASDAELRKALKKLDIHVESHDGRGRLIDSLWKYCRKQIKGPVFLVHHPVAVSPLAKRVPTNPDQTERYQIIIAGSELGNGYSELNDPIDQAERFAQQAVLRERGDVEAQMHDRDFVEALEHGMPPTTGFGMSERVFAFFENKSVRECVLFPLMRPQIDE